MSDIILSQEKFNLFINITKKINSELEWSELRKNIITSVTQLLNCQASSILRLDEITKDLYFEQTAKRKDNTHIIKDTFIPQDNEIAKIVVQTKKAVCSNESNEPRISKTLQEKTAMKINNILAVPIQSKNQFIGVLEAINSNKKDGFNSADIKILEILSDYTSVAITNKTLLHQERSRSVELSAIYSMNKASNFHENIDNFLHRTYQILYEKFKASRISIILEKEKNLYQFLLAKGFSNSNILEEKFSLMEGNILSHVLKQKKTIICNNMEKEKKFGVPKKLRYRSNSFLVVPIMDEQEDMPLVNNNDSFETKKRVIGFICITEKLNGTLFNKEETKFAQTLSHEFLRGYKEIQLKEEVKTKKILENEINIAASVQFKNCSTEKRSNIKELQITEYCGCKNPISGDFFDIFPIAEHKFAIMIIDVSGHGIAASFFMAICHSTLKIYAKEKNKPATLLEKSNKHIFENSSESGMFATASFFILDIKEKQITYANAGHPESFHYIEEKDIVENLSIQNKPLGMFKDVNYKEKTAHFAKNDLFFFYTDGLIELTNKKGEQFGKNRLVKIIEKYSSLSTEKLKEKIISEVQKHSETKEYQDDVTLVIIKIVN